MVAQCLACSGSEQEICIQLYLDGPRDKFHLSHLQDSTHVEGRTQNLRQAASCLTAAVAEFSGCAAELSFVLTLGDIIDGNATPQQTAADFELIAAVFDQLVSWQWQPCVWFTS